MQNLLSQEIRPLKEEEYSSLLLWLNALFGRADTPFFQEHYAHVLSDQKKVSQTSLVLKQGDQYLAHIGVYPMVLKTSIGNLSVSGIGQVAVDPQARGLGLAQKLMQEAHALALQQGSVACFLGGNRSLYGKSGYEICGMHYQWLWDRYRHPQTINVRKITSADFEQYFEKWHQRPYGVLWPEDTFRQILRRPDWEHWITESESPAIASVKVMPTQTTVDVYAGSTSSFIPLINTLCKHYDRSCYVRHESGNSFFHSMMISTGMDITRKMQGMMKILNAQEILTLAQKSEHDLSGMSELLTIRDAEFSPDKEAVSLQRIATRKLFGDPFDQFQSNSISWNIEQISYI